MLLSSELVGKNVVIEMAVFAMAYDKKYKGVVEKIINYGENLIMIKLDTGKILNVNYIRTIDIVD